MFPKSMTANPKKVLKNKFSSFNFPKRFVQNSSSASCRASCFLLPWIEKQPRRQGAKRVCPQQGFVKINCANNGVGKPATTTTGTIRMATTIGLPPTNHVGLNNLYLKLVGGNPHTSKSQEMLLHLRHTTVFFSEKRKYCVTLKNSKKPECLIKQESNLKQTRFPISVSLAELNSFHFRCAKKVA